MIDGASRLENVIFGVSQVDNLMSRFIRVIEAVQLAISFHFIGKNTVMGVLLLSVGFLAEIFFLKMFIFFGVVDNLQPFLLAKEDVAEESVDTAFELDIF